MASKILYSLVPYTHAMSALQVFDKSTITRKSAVMSAVDLKSLPASPWPLWPGLELALLNTLPNVHYLTLCTPVPYTFLIIKSQAIPHYYSITVT